MNGTRDSNSNIQLLQKINEEMNTWVLNHLSRCSTKGKSVKKASDQGRCHDLSNILDQLSLDGLRCPSWSSNCTTDLRAVNTVPLICLLKFSRCFMLTWKKLLGKGEYPHTFQAFVQNFFSDFLVGIFAAFGHLKIIIQNGAKHLHFDALGRKSKDNKYF